jgi:hypothetical protein
MQVNALFAAGVFDNPWVVAVIIIVGALANWLAKRRQEKQAESLSEDDEAPAPSGKPAGEINLEDVFRRLMGEEPPASRPAPPPMPASHPSELRPRPEWQEDEPIQPVRQNVPPVRPPLIGGSQPSVTTTAVSEQLEQATRRFDELSEQGRHPATVTHLRHGHRLRGTRRTASRWRDPRSARQAFVAAMVFAPPKSLEP